MKNSLRSLTTLAKSLPDITFARDPQTGQFANNAPLTTAADMANAYHAPGSGRSPAFPAPPPQGHKLRNTAIAAGALGVGYGGLKVGQAAEAHEKSMPSSILKGAKEKAAGFVASMTQDRTPLGAPLPTHPTAFVDTAAHHIGVLGGSLKDEASRVGKTVSQFLRRNAVIR